jgi:stearoyl-CoA desaturase (delta-9 desaturase)
MTPATSVHDVDGVLRAEPQEVDDTAPSTGPVLTIRAPITEVGGHLKGQRRLTRAITIIPFLGFLIGLRFLWGGISGLDLALLVGLYSVSILGVTIGFHRMLTHGALDAPAPVRIALAIAGSLAVEGSVIRWVADHRRHHMYTDRQGDPHSPHLVDGTGLKATLLGLWHAHIGWFFVEETTRVERFAPDLLKDRGLRAVSALFPLWTVVSFALAPAIALALTHSIHAALTALVWGSLVRIFLLHHVTWSINSVCHFFGRRPYESDDHSTNNWVMSLVSFGEGWHNNHHAFPSSAFHGLEWWQVSGMVIRAIRALGLVRNVHSPSLKQRLLKAVAQEIR